MKSAKNSSTIKLKDEAAREYWKPVTNETIAAVPHISVFGTPDVNDKVEQQCRRILKDIKDDEVGTEATISIALDDLEVKFRKGEKGAGDVEPIILDRPYITIHNHPSGQTISREDFYRFISQKKADSMVVVGNNGTVFVLNKEPQFDYIDYGFKVFNISDIPDYHKIVFERAEYYGFSYYEISN